ncbi:hypothetical protein F441_02612 [Phytophthora nicotianae CJ01A1]|uniref:STI1 domain-containing protein n=3 Tax=Phytophthora nicotianae TaxID=4792 RepID=W2HH12_PHYNI|nr:hypothetical protein L915_02532 [Phytophthora nicotianae]ETL47785.1 hypothetical protein L916_02504 [Phytophthora nicotianae]ETO83264.1 hypothetical protein F444_02651 [Phytophthora nicotianae P1976]ETP24343.1 hypothetical protein F441_02612 [Phytophthora nicotianae CJ01A1]
MKGINVEELEDDEPPMLGEAEAPVEDNQVEDSTKDQDASIMDEMLAVAQRAKKDKRKQQDKERNRTSFGQGLKKGFFNTTKMTTKKKGTLKKSTTTLEPARQQSRDERLLIVNQKQEEPATDNSPFVFPEVQEAMKSMNQLDPKEWMNERFFEKLARNPKLAQALQNPSFSKSISEMQKDPAAAILKYQKDPAVSTMLRDFMEFLGNHFEELGASAEAAKSQKKSESQQQQDSQPLEGLRMSNKHKTLDFPKGPAIVDLDETRRQAIAGMQRSPEEEEQVQRILKNPELLAALSDGNLMQRIHDCQESPGELQRLAHDPVLGPKLRLLVQHNMNISTIMSEHGTGGSGLRSEQQAAERMARELMDMKIETAHLRERLRLRVGGDTTAAELEAEAFALQTALGEAQQTLKSREAELQALDLKYQKAMHGMVRLDEAWKLSKTQMRKAQDAQQAAEQRSSEEKQRGNELQRQLDAASQRETTLANRVDTLVQEKQQLQQQRDEKEQESKNREMQVHELRAQLEVMRHQFETQMKQQEGATREDVRRLQEQLQKAEEQAAALRGEIHARQDEAAKVEAELRDTKKAETMTKQRLVQLTEDHATLHVHLESAKLIAVESTQRAIQAETENESLKTELEELESVLTEKEQTVQTLEEELVENQKRTEGVLVKKKQALEETEQRLTKESQEMLQAQEEAWSCREKFLQAETENYKQKLARMQAFHVELAQLLQVKQGENAEDEQLESVEPAMLKALIVQEINKRDVLTTTLGQLKLKLGATKRQLTSQKQLEAENTKLRAEYEKAKLAMERMATRKAKSLNSVTSVTVQPRSRSSEGDAGKENRTVTPIIKRQLAEDEAETIDVRTTPRKAQRTKHVYVASRYLSK